MKEKEKDKVAARLHRARSVLQVAEQQHGLNPYQQNVAFTKAIRSGVYEVNDQTSHVVQALMQLLPTEFWIAMVGIENLGWEAFGDLGFDLNRVVKVIGGTEKVVQSLSILLEGFEILVIGNLRLAPFEQRTLTAKARHLERIIFTTNRWPFISAPVTAQLATSLTATDLEEGAAQIGAAGRAG